MIINIIGDCDKRPVLYTVMKICQRLGDVLLVSSSSRLMRLSDTRVSFGHYQNTMIAVTLDGIDDFWEEYQYSPDDFDFVIIDNIVTAEADLTIYVKGMIESEFEKDMIEYIEDVKIIDLYKNKLVGGTTLMRCEEFEALRNMCTIGQGVAEAVAKIMAGALGKDVKNIYNIAMSDTNTRKQKSGFGKG